MVFPKFGFLTKTLISFLSIIHDHFKIIPQHIVSYTFNNIYESESEVAQSCPNLCDPMDSSPPGFSVHGISRQEYWSGLTFPSPGDLPNPGIESGSPALKTDALPSEPPGKGIYIPLYYYTIYIYIYIV